MPQADTDAILLRKQVILIMHSLASKAFEQTRRDILRESLAVGGVCQGAARAEKLPMRGTLFGDCRQARGATLLLDGGLFQVLRGVLHACMPDALYRWEGATEGRSNCSKIIRCRMAATSAEIGSSTTPDKTSGRGNCVSTIGRDEATIREYIGPQELEDQRLDQMNL